MSTLENKTILLVITGGIAAYKSLELIRLIRKSGADVRCILTEGGQQFITPLSVASLSENEVYTDLFSLKDETEMGHIRLTREADLVVVAPASANTIQKLLHGAADDLATTTLLASDKPILVAPAMNPEMWDDEATQNNIKVLQERDDFTLIGPESGEMACGETGKGRMSEPEDILEAITDFFYERPLKGYRTIVTSGPTFEPLDPVRFIGNRSSGRQGHAIAQALYEAGAEVTLISGPVSIPAPPHMNVVQVETATEMLKATQDALPAQICICAAAVSDWAPADPQDHKIKKRQDETPPSIQLQENPDILKTIAGLKKDRPEIVVGFAAETENLVENAKEKLARKGCDFLIGNQVTGEESVFGAEENHVYMIAADTTEEWPKSSKKAIARKLVKYITNQLDIQQEERTLHAAE